MNTRDFAAVWENPSVRVAVYVFLGFLVGLVVAKGLTRETVTLFAAILAAVVGFFAYSWQKKVDRREAVLFECRKVYREFIGEAERLLAIHCSDADSESKDKQTAKYRDAYHSLVIYGTESIIAEAKPYLMQVVSYTDPEYKQDSNPVTVEDLRTKIETLVTMMRQDCNDAQTRKN